MKLRDGFILMTLATGAWWHLMLKPAPPPTDEDLAHLMATDPESPESLGYALGKLASGRAPAESEPDAGSVHQVVEAQSEAVEEKSTDQLIASFGRLAPEDLGARGDLLLALSRGELLERRLAELALEQLVLSRDYSKASPESLERFIRIAGGIWVQNIQNEVESAAGIADAMAALPQLESRRLLVSIYLSRNPEGGSVLQREVEAWGASLSDTFP